MYFYPDTYTITAIACIAGAVLAVMFIDKIHRKNNRDNEARKHFKNQ
jgi:hypothetical protein